MSITSWIENPEPLCEDVCERVGSWLRVCDDVCVSLADTVGETLFVCDSDGVVVGVPDGVAADEPLPEAEAVWLGDRVSDPLCDCVVLGVEDALGVPVAEPLALIDGVDDGDALELCVGEGEHATLRPERRMPP